MSVLAAETYYEGMGQNWERAAMIKARAVAGDPQSGAEFLRHLRPFVWRKHLDFAAIQDIHSIKRQIQAVKGHREIAVAGHNIKLGRGGIREIEFFAQTQQLIWGGRQPELRPPATCEAIHALVAAGRVAPATGTAMIAAYRYLRHVEHRLQMVDDRQTQTLPPAGEELEAIARFCGHPDTRLTSPRRCCTISAMSKTTMPSCSRRRPTLAGPGGSLVFTGTDNDPDTVRTLGELGFKDGASISAAIRGWHAGRARAMRSTRARELLTELMPSLLQALGRTSQPDEAFARFDAFLACPAGGGADLLPALFQPRPARPDRRDHGRRAAPGRASQPQPGPARCRADQRLLRPCARAPRAGPGARSISWRSPAICRTSSTSPGAGPGTGSSRSASMCCAAPPMPSTPPGRSATIAETVIAALQPRVEAAFVQQHGRLPGRGMVTVALGKLGSHEMTIGSDLDLIFIYDAPAELEGAGWDTLHVRRAEAAGADPLLRPPGAAHDRRHHRAHRRGPAL